MFARWAPHLDGSRAYEVKIRPYRPRRSLEQNNLLHALIGELAAHLGYSPAELKDVLKHLYGRQRVIEMGGKMTRVPVSTTAYTKAEMSNMIEQIHRLAAEYECVLEATE